MPVTVPSARKMIAEVYLQTQRVTRASTGRAALRVETREIQAAFKHLVLTEKQLLQEKIYCVVLSHKKDASRLTMSLS